MVSSMDCVNRGNSAVELQMDAHAGEKATPSSSLSTKGSAGHPLHAGAAGDAREFAGKLHTPHVAQMLQFKIVIAHSRRLSIGPVL